MVAEKMAALREAQVATVATVLTGRSHTASKKVLQVFEKEGACKQKKALTRKVTDRILQPWLGISIRAAAPTIALPS